MKTKLWMLGAAVAALTSCTQSEVVEMPESRVIKFESHVDKSARAVNELSASTLESFYVFGYHTPYTTDDSGDLSYDFNEEKNIVFHNVLTKSSTTGDYWEPVKDGYWSAGHVYHFAAYSNYNDSLKTTLGQVSYDPNTDVIKFEDYEVVDASSATKQSDLIAAISSDRTGESGTTSVNLTFRHMLAKVSLYLINTSSNSTLSYAGFTINDIKMKGTCEYNFDVNHTINWDCSQATPGNFSFGDMDVDPKTGGVQTEKSIDFYMIPQTFPNNKDVYLKFTLTEKVGDDPVVVTKYKAKLSGAKTGNNPANTSVGPKEINSWEAGYHYNYIITHGQEFQKITFNPSFEDWSVDVNGDGFKGDSYDGITLTLERDDS